MITNFKIFENLRDKMIGKSHDDILKSLASLSVWEQIGVANDNDLPLEFYPSDDDIKKELSEVDEHIIFKKDFADSEIGEALDILLPMIDSKYGEVKLYDADSDHVIYEELESFFGKLVRGDDGEYFELHDISYHIFKEKKVIQVIPDMGEQPAIIFNINFDDTVNETIKEENDKIRAKEETKYLSKSERKRLSEAQRRTLVFKRKHFGSMNDADLPKLEESIRDKMVSKSKEDMRSKLKNLSKWDKGDKNTKPFTIDTPYGEETINGCRICDSIVDLTFKREPPMGLDILTKCKNCGEYVNFNTYQSDILDWYLKNKKK